METGDTEMTFQITRTHQNRTVILKDGITRKVLNFKTREDAQVFADSCFANARCEDKNQGRRLPQYNVVEVK